MGILIKGMEMPKSCIECRLFNDPWCMAKNRNQWRTAYNRPPKGMKQDDCPLIEVPDGHGDLVDINELKISIMNGETGIDLLKHTFDCINNAPTIISADLVWIKEEVKDEHKTD